MPGRIGCARAVGIESWEPGAPKWADRFRNRLWEGAKGVEGRMFPGRDTGELNELNALSGSNGGCAAQGYLRERRWFLGTAGCLCGRSAGMLPA